MITSRRKHQILNFVPKYFTVEQIMLLMYKGILHQVFTTIS